MKTSLRGVYLLSSLSPSLSLIWHSVECYDGGWESGRGGRERQRVRWINANQALILQAHQGRRQGQINAEQRRPAHAESRSHAKIPIAASVPNIPSLHHPSIKRCTPSISASSLPGDHTAEESSVNSTNTLKWLSHGRLFWVCFPITVYILRVM